VSEAPGHLDPLHRTDDVIMWARAVVAQIDRIEAAMSGPEPDDEYPTRFVESHLLFVVADHMIKAVERRPKGRGISELDPSTRGALQQLRDLFEHWENTRRKIQADEPGALSKVRVFAPEAWPWTIAVGRDGSFLVSNSIDLGDLRRKVTTILRQARLVRSDLEEELL
jgi:hypothetical protein